MKNKLIILIIVSTFSGLAFSQSIEERAAVAQEIKSNIERYNVDYKILDESLIESDSSVLNLIDLDHLGNFRNETSNVVITDKRTGIKVVLFFKKEN